MNTEQCRRASSDYSGNESLIGKRVLTSVGSKLMSVPQVEKDAELHRLRSMLKVLSFLFNSFVEAFANTGIGNERNWVELVTNVHTQPAAATTIIIHITLACPPCFEIP